MSKILKSIRESDSRKAIVTQVRANARDIWLAGLGAFAAMQSEGAKVLSVAQTESGKVFNALVKQGMEVEARAVEISVDKAEIVTDKTAQAIGKLEQVFQDRVSRSLSRLGMPTSDDVKALTVRIEALAKNVETLAEKKTTRATTRKSARA